MTWTLIWVFLITNNNVSTYAIPSIVMPGYKSLAFYNIAAKEAIEEVTALAVAVSEAMGSRWDAAVSEATGSR